MANPFSPLVVHLAPTYLETQLLGCEHDEPPRTVPNSMIPCGLAMVIVLVLKHEKLRLAKGGIDRQLPA